jgi:hypothetical protein
MFLNYNFDMFIVFIIYGLDIMMIFFFSKVKLIIFSTGIYYKKKVLKLNQLKNYLIVKNYEGDYEFYKNGNKKVLTLSSYEMNYLQE